MNAKERFYSGLAKETIGKITSNTDNWTSFLRTMSRNYEFTYPEQVMIYAQRPNATFCKPYEDWNAENYRRYVKRGSTGIALFVMNRDKPYLRYVFDVADTGVRRSSPELKPWEVTPENRSYVMEAMERTFGVAADGVLEAQLEDIASALAAEYWDDYKKQFLDIVANSFLEEYDELNIEVAFKNAVANSVSYTMYCRFVESPDNYFEHEDFQKVFDFNTRQTVNALGTAVNAISTRMFQEIEKAIGEHEQIKATERSTDYERDDLQTGRRLSDSEPSVGERGRETSGQVRQDASSIFGTEQSDAPERHDSDGEPVPAPVGDRGNSESQSGVSDGAVPEGQPRTGQGNAADGVGAAHEQPESTGGGSRDDGAYQQLSLNLFLSENEQISFIDRAESFTPSAFSFAQEEIDHFLLLGSNTDEARKVVALEYMKQKPLEEIVQTLKQVYHGGYGLKEDSGNICAWYAEDGIHLAKGSSAIDSPRAQIVSWETVAERIGELLENGRFATNVELVEASGYERQKLAESLWHLYHDLSEEARSSNYLAILHQEPFRGFPDETADLAEKLDDPRFHATLVQQYSEFRKTLAENPDLLRFHYHKLNLIQKQLYELNMPLREYQTDMMQMPLVRQFITDDEVNADLTRGSGFSGGKARIYNYWQENHSAKEKMDFLKHEYGTGGHSHACSGATHSGQDHDAKGVAYTKSGCDKLQMSWAQVVQRIDGLIRKGRYLSPEEEAERQAIEEAKTDPLEDVYDRFAVIDTEDGEYAIWDNQTDDYYVDPEGVTEYFTDEWLANDYLEEVRQSVAAMESVQPEAPVAEPAEVVEASASEEPKWNYQVGDTVYLDDTAFRVEQITDREVQLRDPTLAYPIFRAENRENFERMLSQDERNHAVRVDAQTEEKPVTEDFLGKTEPRDYTPEYQLLDRLRMDCEYFLGAGQHSEKHLWAGNRHAQIAKMRELYEMIPDKPEWLTPEMINSYEERMAPRYLVAAYHHFENGFDDKLDYYTLEEAEKAAQGYVDGTMEDDGFKYDGAAVYDQQEHKCIRIYGDYPDEKAHAQVRASAEPEQQEPEHFIDHFYVAEDIQKRGALDIKEYSSFDDALRAYYALPDTQRKALGAMNTRDLPGSLDFVQCVDGKDTIIQDYAQVDGWQNAEVMDIIAQLEQSITTREIPPVPAVNFHITDDNIGEGGPKQKFARNIAAIETLFKLESENRNATTEEQEILSNYVGWGGLADAFDPDKGNWAKEYQTLKNLLSEDEYAAARASTLNAHYTSPTVIRSIYDAVGQMGFETGNILEPAMGIGNFFGMLPPEMQSSRLYGVELDSITGRIAQKLYPNAEIKVAGFETTDRRDFYDLAVGNVPFGNYKVSDKPYDKLGFSIHNYFFAKALDQVRPGGVVAFVTSRYTMDSKNSDARRYMAQRAELLGAIRLPNDAFKKNAGTEVVSDILFLQKRDHPIDIVPEWVNLDRTEEGHTMNSYFVAHPEMVLGDTVEESTAYGMDITVRPIEGMELSELLKEAVSHIQGTYQAVELPEADKGKEIETIPATPDVKNFSYTVVDGNVYFRENSLMRRVDLNEKAKDRVMGMVELRGIVNELIEYQLEDYPDEMITQKQAELNDAYDAFAAKNGLINNRANGQAFADDSSYYLLCSLENVDEDGNLKSKADMFTKRTIKPERRVTSVDTPSEALAISIGERGKVDLPFMAQLLGTPGEYDAIQAELRGVIFKDPMAPDAVEVGWQTADDYLSGDVRSKKFCARIATGDYDAVIIGHSQFEKIPLSAERQERQLREQIDEIEGAIAELKWQRGENFTIKQMEKTRKSLEARLDKLLAADKKDDVITFEQLGVDRLFVDESHAFKNLFLYTKMRNVAGLSTSEAQKSSDMFMKCRYMDELTGGRGVIFATGTPVSNSMTELYTVMRYLQYSTLQQKNLTHFDSWASTFGETTTAIELAPEGTGYRARTRFAKFFNLPELMNMFKEVADIKTSDQLHLPVPEAKFETVVVQPSEYQKDMVASLSERAADVHAGIVDPSVDNMLKITSDGRKLGLDQRLMNTLLPDDPDSKLNACVGNILRIWQDGQADKLTQLVFCDLSTPKNDGTFNVYDDVKTKLIANGVPAEEVAFIHDADTEAKKKDLFAKVRTGQVRVLLGSTQKMGAGTNVQDKLVAVHHLDVGWRPSDMTQRNGRIIRQGNRNKEVQVYQYVTEGTFDAYLYQTLENKQKFISQIMTSKSPVRSCDDVDEQALSYAEIKALCAGNPLIKEKMDLDIDVARLKVLKADHQSQQYRMEDKLLKYFPAEIEKQTGYIHGFEADIKTVEAHPQIADGFCGMEIMGKAYTEKADAGEILLAACKDTKSADPVPLGSYRGFQMELSFDSFRNEFDVTLKGAVSHRVALGTDARGNITRLDNALAGILERLERANEQLNNLYNQQEAAKAEVGKPFPQEAELTAKSQRLAELDAALNMEDSVENRDERSESERPSVLADLKSKAEHIPPAKYSETREEVL